MTFPAAPRGEADAVPPEPAVLESRVPPRMDGQALLDYLAIRFGYKPRAEWDSQIRGGKVTVNGAAAGPGDPLKTGDRVAYEVLLREPPVDADIRILHDEPRFVVALKTGQLPSHADGNFIRHTFIHILTERLRAGGWTGLVRLAHRLDRETSGVMVVAKDKAAHVNLMRQFAAGTVDKEYLAVVAGRPARDAFEVSGTFGRDPASVISIRQGPVPPGTPYAKHSVTRFARIRDLAGATLLRCLPKTGRTNQIRVHLASVGHPVVGDKLYGRTDEEFLAYIRHVKAGGDPGYAGHAPVPRQLLHAAKLSFNHPATGARVSFAAPPPPDMQAWIDTHPDGGHI